MNQTGFQNEEDYRGKVVAAAYAPLGILGWGKATSLFVPKQAVFERHFLIEKGREFISVTLEYIYSKR